VVCACSSDPGEPQRASTSSVSPPPQTTERPECVEIAKRFSTAYSRVRSESPVERLAEIRTAAAAAGEDPAGCLAGRLEKLVTEQRRKLVRLFLNEQEAAPAAIYECPELGPRFRCQGAVADDTAHLGEMAAGGAIPNPGSIRMELARDYKPISATPYLLKTPNGSLEKTAVPLTPASPLYAMVVIVQEHDSGYVKYVWLLQGR